MTAPGQNIREGIELLLKGNLTNDGDNAASRTGSVDASTLLAKGFTMLRNNPYDQSSVGLALEVYFVKRASISVVL